jgi:hypothetical protein
MPLAREKSSFEKIGGFVSGGLLILNRCRTPVAPRFASAVSGIDSARRNKFKAVEFNLP